MRISRRSVKISPWWIGLPVKMPRPKPWEAAFLRWEGARYSSHESPWLEEKNDADAHVAPRRRYAKGVNEVVIMMDNMCNTKA
mmetsp:Transcript_16208/g.22963  ORF Transcript_16208/g.22963 Transcript_16208/m.22963 type:complete len:83 (-) Transcript_16208:6-254(-)